MDTYEKKLALAKEALDSGSYDKETIEYIFPELNESKSIRLWLIDLLSTMQYHHCDEDMEMGNKALDWLEAQGEQKPLGFNIGDEITVNGQICKVVAVEQKPTERNEEDEINLGKAIWYVENPAPMVAKDSMLVEWLKNIRGRVQPQHKQEWSEEDENRLSTIIAEFSKCAGKSVSKDEWMRCNDFLNSLKERYTWKPSDEQLHGLDVAITTLRCQHNAVIKGLDSLYIDLKKLKD